MKKMVTISLCGWLLSVFLSHATEPEVEVLYAPYPKDVTPELSDAGEFPVGVTTRKVKNAQAPSLFGNTPAERSLTLEIWYPSAQTGEPSFYENVTRSGKVFRVAAQASRDSAVRPQQEGYPVVVLSHGYTGYRTIMYYLGEHLASHGYVVIGIDHTDSTNQDVDFAQAPFAGFPSTLFNRSRDQLFALDAVSQMKDFKRVVNHQVAGLIGYSMGGFGAVSTVGGCYAFSPAQAGQFTGVSDENLLPIVQARLNSCAGGKASTKEVDPRWKAMVALAPWGGQWQLFSPSSLEEIQVPVLYVGGEHDDISGYAGIRWLFEHTGSQQSQLLTYANARHNIAPHPAPRAAYGNEFDIGHYYEPAWRSQTLNDINKHFTLAWMNCHLRQQASACEFLAVEGSSDQAQQQGALGPVWKGFDHRYALGLRMASKPQATLVPN